MSDPKNQTVVRVAVDPGDSPRERRTPGLVVVAGADIGKRHPLPAGGLVIGRDPHAAGLVLVDPAVSARHCVVELVGGGSFRVSDLGSRNGTFVNGEKVGERTLVEGDKIFVGETVLRFSLSDEIEEQFHDRIEVLMNVDALTGLLVKRAFDLELARAFEAAKRAGAPLGLLMMDLDGLKSINDHRGHQMGSLCIAEVGAMIRQEIQPFGRACRYGGDEFIALVEARGADGAAAIGERIRARVEGYEFVRDGVRVSTTISIGVAELEPGLATPDHLLQLADEALYRAKRAGRNRVER
ncbi:MAG TPA: GGDEF domain-containing protein [Myxococcota bacterium]|nr:GGDEF domain-containing protein [Myxococcota bacterium]